VEILQSILEVSNYNTSTKRSSNPAPFDKISKSGDGGGSGGTLDILTTSIKIQSEKRS
jgi:hypothetical protein